MNPNTKILGQLAGLDDVEICLADLPANPSPKESQYDPISLAGKRAFATPRTVALLLGSRLIRQHAPFGSPPPDLPAHGAGRAERRLVPEMDEGK